MELLDTKYIDVVIEGKTVLVKIDGGVLKGQLEIPLIEILKQLAAKSDNTLDDALVALVEKALA